MSQLKRDLVKYIRDKAKSKYVKEDKCYICNSIERLDFHHYFSLTDLLAKWLRINKINIDTAEDIINVRDQFIEEHLIELYDECVTLCHVCHSSKLHSIYGKNPGLATAKKQKRWVEIQREKNGLV